MSRPKTTTAELEVPPPRNAIEIPLYVLCMWGVWPPIQLLLGIPFRDLDDRFSSARARVVSVHPVTRRLMKGRVSTQVPGRRMQSRTGARVGFVIESGRAARRGPRRASSSMQNILDIGLGLPAAALAWMVIWRDLGIGGRNLGTINLAQPHARWWSSLRSMEINVRKHRERFRAEGASEAPSPMMPSDLDGRRVAAVIAARGAAAYCGGSQANVLLADAFKRYAPWDAQLAAITLPAIDMYRYHPDVRAIAPFFAAPGATVCTYASETTHMVVHRAARAQQEEESRTIDL